MHLKRKSLISSQASGNNSDLYAGGAQLESLLQHKLHSLSFFVVSLSSSRLIPGLSLKLHHDRFLPNPFQFIIHLSPFYLTLLVLVAGRRSFNYKQT